MQVNELIKKIDEIEEINKGLNLRELYEIK